MLNDNSMATLKRCFRRLVIDDFTFERHEKDWTPTFLNKNGRGRDTVISDYAFDVEIGERFAFLEIGQHRFSVSSKPHIGPLPLSLSSKTFW